MLVPYIVMNFVLLLLLIYIVDDNAETFLAHKFMLTSTSPVFFAMFSGNFMEGQHDATRVIEVTDVDPAAFHKMLK